MKVLKYSALCAILALGQLFAGGGGKGNSYLSDEPIPYMFPRQEDQPKRTPPLLELGDAFLGKGNLKPGFRTFTGAVWQPRFWVYGNMRTTVQHYRRGDRTRVSEWANRLDLFGNLQLTGTERILIGIQPLHDPRGFTGTQKIGGNSDFEEYVNADIRTLFFEGDLAEVFPNFDLMDKKGLDVGFSIGRQNLVFQDGLLINDRLDLVGLTKNSLRFNSLPWINNLRVTALYAWNDVHRDNNVEDEEAYLVGLFSAIDTDYSTIDVDFAFVESTITTGNLAVWGIGGIQRIGEYNLTTRLVGSAAMDTNDTAASNDGHLLFSELSWTPHGYVDVAYINAYYGLNQFRSAARDTFAGGPLGRTGLLFAARGIGTYPAAMSNRPDDAFGISIGRQFFLGSISKHLILELGYRNAKDATVENSTGLAAQYQMAVNKRTLWQVDGFSAFHDGQEDTYGIRTEFLVKF